MVFVHGAGYLQNVDHKWSTYYHEYMFHHFLMEHGYTVIDMDYRGSAGYGRDWRTAIYDTWAARIWTTTWTPRNGWSRARRRRRRRIGLYGGSYGGFITLMAMFTQPDVFRRRRGAAAGDRLGALQSRLHVGHPERAAEGCRGVPASRRPSISRNGLKGALLICHGMVDTNVHFQDTVRLVQKLIELRKENWSVAPYPVENHGFVQPTSWADEYKRIFALFEKNL